MTPEKFTYYKLGIPHIDDEHWTMFVMLQEILNQHRNGKYDEVNSLLAKLLDELEHHSDDEIRLMTALNYPFLESHILEHELLALKMKLVVTNADKGNYDTLQDDLDYILIQHIVNYDLLYAEYAHTMKIGEKPVDYLD